MEIYKCFVPRSEYHKAKDLTILIYNKERKKYLNLTDSEYERRLAVKIRKIYKAHQGIKPLKDILQEYYDNLKKEG